MACKGCRFGIKIRTTGPGAPTTTGWKKVDWAGSFTKRFRHSVSNALAATVSVAKNDWANGESGPQEVPPTGICVQSVAGKSETDLSVVLDATAEIEYVRLGYNVVDKDGNAVGVMWFANGEKQLGGVYTKSLGSDEHSCSVHLVHHFQIRMDGETFNLFVGLRLTACFGESASSWNSADNRSRLIRIWKRQRALAPVANAGPDQQTGEETLVTLDATGSKDPGNQPLTYSWDQLRGPTVTLSDPTAAQPTFTAPELLSNTALAFRVTVSNGTQTSVDAVVIKIRANDDAPTADAGPDQTVDENTLVTLDGTASTDPEGQPLTYRWKQVGGPPVNLSDRNIAEPSFTAPDLVANTDLTFRLVVSDGNTKSANTVIITVEADNDAPSANAGPDQSVAKNSLVTLDGTGSTDPEGEALTYAWLQTEGPTVTLSNTLPAEPTFTAPDVATDTDLVFELTVMDAATSSVDTVTVTVLA